MRRMCVCECMHGEREDEGAECVHGEREDEGV